MLQNISDAVAQSGIPFLDLAANQMEFAKAVQEANLAAFEAPGPEAGRRDGPERVPA